MDDLTLTWMQVEHHGTAVISIFIPQALLTGNNTEPPVAVYCDYV